METIKDILTLFLQITGVGVVVTTLWLARKPMMRLATPLTVFALDRALKHPVYETVPCLSTIIDELVAPSATTQARFYAGFRPNMGDADVLREFTQWTEAESRPVSSGPFDDSEERWANETARFADNYNLLGLDKSVAAPLPRLTLQRGILDNLWMFLKTHYDYDLARFPNEEPAQQQGWSHAPETEDIWKNVIEKIDSTCGSQKSRAQARWTLGHSSKNVNVIQINNPYHESFKDIHVRISHKNLGLMHLAETVAEREGFTILNKSSQYLHLVLEELPPNAARYCLVETATQPLRSANIEIQSGVLLRLSPTNIKCITLVALVIAFLVAYSKQLVELLGVGG